MFKFFLLLLTLTPSLFSLNINVQSGKEDFHNFSIISISHDKDFYCENIRNDFDKTTEVACVFDEKPQKNFDGINNNFFTLITEVRESNYFLIIKPHHNMKLKAEIFDLSVDNTFYNADIKKAKRWTVIGFNEKAPFSENIKQSESIINFPLEMKRHKIPFVGGLDISGNPIHMSRIQDVSDYMTIKNFYGAKQYRKSLNLIEDVLENYPNTIFKSELLLYKMRSFHNLDDSESLLSISKTFVRNYSSNENIPEVLAYTAKAYSDVGMFIDADYFFDRVFSEHEESPYFSLAQIYKGEQVEASGGLSKALNYYKKAYYSAQSMETASIAAYKLAKVHMGEGKVPKASEYIYKIIDGHIDFFKDNFEDTIELAMEFSDHSDYKTASDMGLAILQNLKKGSEVYELLLKNIGVWLSKTDKKAESVELFNRYLQEFAYGSYTDEVIRTKDGLFFDANDTNITKKLAEFDALIIEYDGDSISNRALYEKTKLLFELKEYQNVLDLNNSLMVLDLTLYDEIPSLITQSAEALMKELLTKRACVESVDLSKKYAVSLSQEFDDAIYYCALKSGNNQLALFTAQKHIQDRDLSIKMKWLMNYIKADYTIGHYSEVIKAGKELIELEKIEETQEYRDVVRYMFDSAQRLDLPEEMISYIQKVEEYYGLDYDDIERYTKVLALAIKLKDNVLIETYAKKIMQLQKNINSYTQSPFVEFTLSQLYSENNKYKKAIEVLVNLENVDLDSGKVSRFQYLLGALYVKDKQNDKAKKAYEMSIKADENSAWGKLSKDAIELIN